MINCNKIKTVKINRYKKREIRLKVEVIIMNEKGSKYKSKYKVLAEFIVKQIKEGNLKAGEKLLSREKMVKKYNVSGNTVNHAIDELVQLGFVVKKHRSGTYVSENIPKINTNLISIVTSRISFDIKDGDGLFNSSVDVRPLFIQKLQEKITEKGFKASINVYNLDFGKELEFLSELKDGKVDGVFCFFFEYNNKKILEEYSKFKAPLIFVDDYPSEIFLPVVTSDNYGAVYRLVSDILVRRGYEKIVCISHGYVTIPLTDREHGYKVAMNNHKMSAEILCLTSGQEYKKMMLEDELINLVSKIYSYAENHKTAVISLTPEAHWILWEYSIDNGLPIEKIAWCSFDDPNITYPENVKHVEIIQDFQKIAEVCADKMIKILKKEILTGNEVGCNLIDYVPARIRISRKL